MQTLFYVYGAVILFLLYSRTSFKIFAVTIECQVAHLVEVEALPWVDGCDP